MNRLHQLVRYGAVSLISTAVGLTVLGTLVVTGALSPGWANVVATAVGTIPSFELNRRWVWRKHGHRSVAAEVLPFCALSFAGLALSTLSVSVTASVLSGTALGSTVRTIAIEAAHLAGFGALWLVQFVILDRVLFGRTHAPDGLPRVAPMSPSPRTQSLQAA